MKLLKELFFGHIAPWEQKMNLGAEYKEKCCESIRLEEEFLTQLNELQRQCYMKYDASRMTVTAEESYHFFSSGFQLGARMIMEILQLTEA